MTSLGKKTIGVSILVLLLVVVAGIKVLGGLTSDGYLGQPQVVGLPPGYDPLANTSPYTGEHPSRKDRPPDPYTYPIPIDQPGPVIPTYADSLDYPFVCRTERSNLGQPLVDNQDQAGTAVYALDDAGKKSEKIIGYSKDCSINTRVLYYYRSTESGEFLPLEGSYTLRLLAGLDRSLAASRADSADAPYGMAIVKMAVPTLVPKPGPPTSPKVTQQNVYRRFLTP